MRELSDLLGVGVEASRLTIGQVSLRAIVIFFATLFIVRIANKRFFAKKTAFDIILAFILASMMARAVNGSEQLAPTIVAGLVLALLHRLLGFMACRWPQLGEWIKGSSQTVIKDGKVDREALRKHHFGDDDLLEELRLNGVDAPDEVKLARLERSGEVSVVKK
jgi:uncharacterized membrane protein YcaP (DUF421 family)